MAMDEVDFAALFKAFMEHKITHVADLPTSVNQPPALGEGEVGKVEVEQAGSPTGSSMVSGDSYTVATDPSGSVVSLPEGATPEIFDADGNYIPRPYASEGVTDPNAIPPRPTQELRDAFNLLTQLEVCNMLNITEPTLRSWRNNGRGPTFVKFCKQVFYTRKHLTEWLERNEYTQTPSGLGRLKTRHIPK